MAADPESWFCRGAGPDSLISKYVAAAPRGMTSPPQNPLVREALLSDLEEYGIQLEHPSWPPPAPAVPPGLRPHASTRGSKLIRSLSTPSASSSSEGRRDSQHSRSKSQVCATEASVTVPWRKNKLWGSCKGSDPYSQQRDHAMQSAGFPTGRWHATRGPLDDLHASPARSSQNDRSHAPNTQPGKSKNPVSRVIDDREIQYAKDALKAQASLHAAAKSDRFSLGGDTSAGGQVVIRGAGTPAPLTACAWSSDASKLNNFHHKAIRKVAPSGLQPMKETPEDRKRKRKKKTDETEALQLSESGLFEPKYPVDGAFRLLRRLQREHFPEEMRKKDQEAAELAAAKAAEEDAKRNAKINFLKSNLHATDGLHVQSQEQAHGESNA